MSNKSHKNRLIKEKSPYLLQHAHNPVDWYPWGEEAFAAAKEKDKPIFLSIGYATCHFCHAMARESFEHLDIAMLMNQTFVNIKVDREELPEIDSLYMEFAQALMASSSGWPLNLILTPQLKPFYATGYMTPESHQNVMGLKELICHIGELWKSEERELLFDQAEKLVDFFSRNIQTKGFEIPGKHQIDQALETFFENVDPIFFGFKGSPKFPLGYQVFFLLRYAKIRQDPRPLFYVEKTLEMMYRGGIYDPIEGGFARYSVDEKWEIPHFEKILSNNALLVSAYLECWKMTKKPLYQSVVQNTLEYLLQEMQHEEGGFYSAQDAETDGVEGAYYLWSFDEIKKLFSEEDFSLFRDYFGITKKGNFHGKNVLHRCFSIEDFANQKEKSVFEIEEQIKKGLEHLKRVRKKRKVPFKDDKILVAPNAMIIDTLARCFLAFRDENYLKCACNAATFIHKHFWKSGTLLRRFRAGQTDFEGGLDDYAYLIRALITLFEVDQKGHWLKWALEMTHFLEKHFKANEGAFYQTTSNHSILLRRPELFDGAQPSGNAIHAENLLRLEQITKNRRYRIQAEDILKVSAQYIKTYPQGACYHLMALQHYLDKEAMTCIVAFNEELHLKEEIANILNALFLPHTSLIWKDPNNSQLEEILPYLKEFSPINHQTTIYICNQKECEAPYTSLEKFQKRLER